MKDKLDWHFKLVNITDYEITATMKAKNELVSRMYKSKFANKLKEKDDTLTEEEIINKSPDRFSVPESHLQVITIAMGAVVKTVQKEVGEDGIKLLSDRVTEATFEKNSDKKNWTITVTIRGEYLR